MVTNCNLRTVLSFIRSSPSLLQYSEENHACTPLRLLCPATGALRSLTISSVSVNKLKLLLFCRAYSSKTTKPLCSCIKLEFNWKPAHLNEVATEVCRSMLAHTATNSKEFIFVSPLEHAISL